MSGAGTRTLLVAASVSALLACTAVPPNEAIAQPVPRDALAPVVAGPGQATPAPVATDTRVVFPETVQQGALVIGKVPSGSVVNYGGRSLRVTPYGSVVFGVARDQVEPVQAVVELPGGGRQAVAIQVTPRDWPVETIRGAPASTIRPSPAVAERIAREQALVTAARTRDDARTGFAETFAWPVQGRISGRFGNHRVYLLPDGTGSAGSSHSGMDIAAPSGTPILAPAAGVVTFADPDLYLTGGTVLLDHGHGVSSNFLHLARIDVRVGDQVAQGQAIGTVGATGRATGPHLHWGMNWFDVRVDPLLVLERGATAGAAGAP